jgi:hypothetical protein
LPSVARYCHSMFSKTMLAVFFTACSRATYEVSSQSTMDINRFLF